MSEVFFDDQEALERAMESGAMAAAMEDVGNFAEGKGRSRSCTARPRTFRRPRLTLDMPIVALPTGVSLYYEERGAGEPVLLIAGTGGDHSLWDATADVLRGVGIG